MTAAFYTTKTVKCGCFYKNIKKYRIKFCSFKKIAYLALAYDK